MAGRERDSLNPYRPLDYSSGALESGGGGPEDEEESKSSGDYLKSVIFGCNDGVCFSVVVVSAVLPYATDAVFGARLPRLAAVRAACVNEKLQ